MGWKIPIKYKQRDIGILVLQNNRTTKQHSGSISKEKHIIEELSQRPAVVKIKTNEAKKYKPCPRHGKKYLVKEGGAVYCFAETKGEMFDRCFYHVSFKDDKDACNEEAPS